MPDLQTVCEIIKKRSDDINDKDILTQLTTSGYSEDQVKKAMDALYDDSVLEVSTIGALTPISPIIYRFGMKRIEKERRVLHGLFKETEEIAVKAIDKVSIYRSLISATVIIYISTTSKVVIDKVSPKDAEQIRTLYADIIESQRKSIINIAEDD